MQLNIDETFFICSDDVLIILGYKKNIHHKKNLAS